MIIESFLLHELRSCVAMEHFDSSTSRDEKVEPIELLEENWFCNLFQRKTSMVRCASEPTPSGSSCQEMTVRSPGDKSSSSMPELPWMSTDDYRNQQALKEPKVDNNPSKDIENPYNKQSSSLPEEPGDDGSVQVHQNLVAAPSLPCSSHGSRKLMRQASLNPTTVLPLQHNSKSKTPSPSIRRHSASREINGTLSRRKTMSDLEIEELQGFKDLGFIFNKEDLSPSVVKIVPGLKDRSEENWEEDKVRKPYLSEAWLLQRSAPLMPNWADKRSAGDMKEQLKFWARAVASNVRQEC